MCGDYEATSGRHRPKCGRHGQHFPMSSWLGPHWTNSTWLHLRAAAKASGPGAQSLSLCPISSETRPTLGHLVISHQSWPISFRDWPNLVQNAFGRIRPGLCYLNTSSSVTEAPCFYSGGQRSWNYDTPVHKGLDVFNSVGQRNSFVCSAAPRCHLAA